MAQSGVRLVEVGTTNKTYLEDYRRAISAETGVLMRVHPSNYRVVGFQQEVPWPTWWPWAANTTCRCWTIWAAAPWWT